MKTFLIAMIVLLAGGARSQELRIEDHICSIVKPDTILCTNTSEHCKAFKKRQDEWHEKTFGCAVPTSKNFPCPPWSDEIERIRHDNVEGYVCQDITFIPDHWHDDRPKQ